MTSRRSNSWWRENKEAASDLYHLVKDTGWKGIVKKSLQRKYIAWWILAIISIAGAIVLAVFRDTIVEKITPQREAIVNFPFSWLLPSFLILLFSFPPFTGRSVVLIIIGAIYGLKIGLLTGTLAVLVGESLCFWVFKTLFAEKAARIEQKNLFYACVARMQRKSGIIFLSIVRYSFIPGRVVSATQSISGMPFWKYFASVVLSMPKMLSAVWLGDLIGREPSPDNEKEHLAVTITVLVVTNLAGVIALYEVYMRARRYYPELREGRQSKESFEHDNSGSDNAEDEERKMTLQGDQRSRVRLQQSLLSSRDEGTRASRAESSDSSESEVEGKEMASSGGSAFVPISR